MNAVYYSLVLDRQAARYQNQWIRSIQSLRRFNRSIPVHLFLFNGPSAPVVESAHTYDVFVHDMGNYRDCLQQLAGDEGATLSILPTLHKLLPLDRFDSAVTQLLFLDCDTYFFRDVAGLFPIYRDSRFYAREEHQSRRSTLFGYQPQHIDEDALCLVAAQAGTQFVPPYNSGVMLLNHGLAQELAALKREFLRCVWQLTLGASRSKEIRLPPGIAKSLSSLAGEEIRESFAYPSRNYWIIDQIALCLTLGRIPNLSHGAFAMGDVLQSGEFRLYRSYRTKSTVVHYFSGNEERFLAHLGEFPDPPR